MNATRLREIIDLALGRENEYKIQKLLNDLNASLTQLVSQPQDPNVQNQFSTALEALGSATSATRTSFEPAQVLLLKEIGADEFFVDDFGAQIGALIRANPLSPAVTQQKLGEFLSRRKAYIQQITQLRENLNAVGVTPISLEPGDAEIGFLLPRALFNNRLDSLIKELRDIHRIIRAFSEVATGSVSEVEVREISTSDPLFFFQIDPLTIASIGAAVTWALNTWKQVEEIRRVRSETRKTNVLTEKEATDVFDRKINERIESSVEEKVNQLTPDDGKPGRSKEQRADLTWALQSILAHVERGMIVEVRFVPPPLPEGLEPADAREAKERLAFEDLRGIASQLVFPKMEGPPILKLPQPPPAADPRNE